MDKVGRLVAAVNLMFPDVRVRGFVSRDVSAKPAEGEPAVAKWWLRPVNSEGYSVSLVQSLDDVVSTSHDEACDRFSERLMQFADDRVTKREEERAALKKLLANP